MAVPLRFGQFNIRDLTMRKLRDPRNPQALAAARIIKKFAPDVLSVNEMEADPAAPRAFIENFLQKGEDPVDYPFYYAGETNSGEPAGFQPPFDYKGFGLFRGQYGIVCLSKFRIDIDGVKNYRGVPWISMPLGYCAEADPPCPGSFPLWSTAFLDIPIEIVPVETGPPAAGGATVHFILLHPTVPLRNYMNLRRNADQLRFLKRYIGGQGLPGVPTLSADTPFVIMGDLNTDPDEGVGTCEVIKELLENPDIIKPGAGRKTFLEEGGADWPGADRRGLLTARLDYILPSSRRFIVKDFCVFNPGGTPWWPVVRRASDHFFICADCELI